MFCMVKKREILFPQPSQCFSTHAIQSKHSNTGPPVYMMLSEAVSGGEWRDPDVQAETEANSGSKMRPKPFSRRERCSTSL